MLSYQFSGKGNLRLDNDIVSSGKDKLRFDGLGGVVDLGRGIGEVTASKRMSILVVESGIGSIVARAKD